MLGRLRCKCLLAESSERLETALTRLDATESKRWGPIIKDIVREWKLLHAEHETIIASMARSQIELGKINAACGALTVAPLKTTAFSSADRKRIRNPVAKTSNKGKRGKGKKKRSKN